MRSIHRLLLIALVAASGCHGQGTTQSTWSANITPAISGEENSIVVYDPTSTAPSVNASLHMTDMEMPVQHVVLTASGDHSFRSDHVRFSMSGGWELDEGAHRMSVQVR